MAASTTGGDLPVRVNGAKSSPLLDDHTAPLKIAIIGAGIGGLSAAIGFRQAGHQTDVSPLCAPSSASSVYRREKN